MINDKIIVAFDTNERDQLDFLIRELKGSATYVKVGMETFYSFGTDIIRELKDNNFKIFLDLKMHDIPNTVAKTAKVLAKLDVDMVNLHAAGGCDMMAQAANAYREFKNDGLIIAVTHLTSTSEQMLKEEIGIQRTMEQAILDYATYAKTSGIDGVVCSAHEVIEIKEHLGRDFKCVTPGIRLSSKVSDDQVRIMTPNQAITAGSDFLVIGRPITLSNSPKETYNEIVEELKNGTNC